MISHGDASRSVWIVDTTLRDGEQSPGVRFSLAQACSLATRLAGAGVDELEIATPAMGQTHTRRIREIVAMNLPVRLTAWCRANEADLDLAGAASPAVHVSIPASKRQLAAIGKNVDWAANRLGETVAYAVQRFDYVSVGVQDASRARFETLSLLARIARSTGARRFRLADTVGVWNPLATSETFSRLAVDAKGMDLGFHGHNDLGMAVGNSIAAALSGAASVDVTVNGLGERAGNASLAETVMALRVSAGVNCGVDSRSLPDLSRQVAELTGRPVDRHAPVVGADIFQHESGIHVRSVLRDPGTYEPYQPQQTLGGARDIRIGSHSGATAVQHALAARGIDIGLDQARELLPMLRERAGDERTLDELAETVRREGTK